MFIGSLSGYMPHPLMLIGSLSGYMPHPLKLIGSPSRLMTKERSKTRNVPRSIRSTVPYD
eukprot:8289369-Pyramimonas_sp.AAC.2